jgi:hypothetical protein
VAGGAPVPQFGLLVTGTGKHPSTLVVSILTWHVQQSPSLDIPDVSCNLLSSNSDSDSSSKSSESSALSSPSLSLEDEEDQLLNINNLTLEDLPNLMKQ